jgi:DNA repair exonuclease SbcCD ATPase subunit
MKIMRLTLENFKGVKNLTLELNGRDANIYGENATGKTSIADAFTWLMFGRPYEESADFTPKTIVGEEYAHNLDHAVECDIDVDGEVVTFKRVYHEVYKKVRGSAESVLSGNTTDYYINGVPKKEKEYQRYWEDIFPNSEIPKLLSMPYYFSEKIHWEKRRQLLLEICGDISDAVIMDTDGELKALAALIGRNSVDEYKKIVKASLRDINSKLQLLPARIDEAHKAIPDTTGYTRAGLDAKLSAIRSSIADAGNERAALLSGGNAAADTRAQLADLNAALSEERSKYSERERAATASLYEQIKNRRAALSIAEGKLADAERRVSQAGLSVSTLEKKRADILAEHAKVKEEHAAAQAEVFDESATICPCCGQTLPRDKADELREAFNVRKSNRLTELTSKMNAAIARGQKEASKEMLLAARQEHIAAVGGKGGAEHDVFLAAEALTEAETALTQAAFPSFETTDEYKRVAQNIEQVKTSERQAAPDTTAIDECIAGYRTEERNITNALSALETEATQKARIAELEAEEKTLGKAYEVLLVK